MSMKIYIGKRAFGRNKFGWFYSPILKKTMKANGIIIFWWLGYNWYFCLKKKMNERKSVYSKVDI